MIHQKTRKRNFSSVISSDDEDDTEENYYQYYEIQKNVNLEELRKQILIEIEQELGENVPIEEKVPEEKTFKIRDFFQEIFHKKKLREAKKDEAAIKPISKLFGLSFGVFSLKHSYIQYSSVLTRYTTCSLRPKRNARTDVPPKIVNKDYKLDIKQIYLDARGKARIRVDDQTWYFKDLHINLPYLLLQTPMKRINTNLRMNTRLFVPKNCLIDLLDCLPCDILEIIFSFTLFVDPHRCQLCDKLFDDLGKFQDLKCLMCDSKWCLECAKIFIKFKYIGIRDMTHCDTHLI
jgi:hypothetical protein